MSRGLTEGSLLLLDACCLINLFATGRIEEILQRLPYEFATSSLVATKEVLTLVRSAGPPPLERELIPRSELENLESLAILDIATEEEMTQFVRFAADLDDGEASVCALAVVRGGAVVTDDRKALSLLSRAAPLIATTQTPEILWEWACLSQAPEDEIRELLRAVQERARFRPRRDAPRYNWWNSFFQGP
ncbi:MAG TPA: hypothetical protein VGG03_14150 [Thermoanaerobaculia bacterium]|jgi:predicted nucleic acid-binding protein